MSATAAWLPFPASPAAPNKMPPPLALEGYLTGIVVAPELIRPSLWIGALWGDEGPIFEDAVEMNAALMAVTMRYNTLLAEIDRSLARLEGERICDYHPAFLTAGDRPAREAVQEWAGGFWKAMALAPEGWRALVEDERTQVLVGPFVGFFDLGEDSAFEPADDIDERLDDSIEEIPRAILILRKLAKLREARATQAPIRRTKIGRNDPCPCGSGKKSKRCCGER